MQRIKYITEIPDNKNAMENILSLGIKYILPEKAVHNISENDSNKYLR